MAAVDDPVETSDLDGAFPGLDAQQVATLSGHGERRRMERGDVLVREGQRDRDFMVVLSGMVGAYEGYGTPEQQLVRLFGPGRFLDEIGLLTGQPAFVSSVAYDSGEVLAVPLSALRTVVAADPKLGDLILRAFICRRELLIGAVVGIRIIGSPFSPDTRRLREFAARNRLPNTWIDCDSDAGVEALLQQLGVRPEETPIVIWRGRNVLRNPGTAELARLLGLAVPGSSATVCDLVVVGAGPAGLAAAVYGASEGLQTVVLDSVATGGQAATSSRIENYLGFPTGISGAELADRAVIQAERFGATITVPADATGLGYRDGYQAVRLGDGSEIRAWTVVIATGARYRRLDVPRLDEFEGGSIYYAATVMEARFCRQQPVVVVGGGNAAGQAIMFLSRHAASVRLLIRHKDLGRDMSRYLVDQIDRNPHIEVLPCTEVREPVGRNGQLEAVIAEDTRTGERRRLDARYLFVFIGAQPCTGWLRGNVALDGHGYVCTGSSAAPADRPSTVDAYPSVLQTSRPGVLAVGDVRSGSIKRVASAVGEGAMAVRLVHEHLARTGRTAGHSEPSSKHANGEATW
jgi:thioredoxin reductase (NADPH)